LFTLLTSCNEIEKVLLSSNFSYLLPKDALNSNKKRADVDYINTLFGADTVKSVPLLGVIKAKNYINYISINLNFTHNELKQILIQNLTNEVITVDSSSLNLKFVTKIKDDFVYSHLIKMKDDSSFLFTIKSSDSILVSKKYNENFVPKSIISN